jgi:hypothetical protein
MAPTTPIRVAAPLRQAAGRLSFVLGLAIAWGTGPMVPRIAHAQPGAPSVLVANALVLALRPLDFNVVLPGITKTVDALDPHGGVMEVRGDPTKQVRISLTLPTLILTTGGVFMPVVYGASDAILSTAFDPTIGTRFDPNAPRLTCLNPATGSAFLFLGGRVLPRTTQRRGDYAGTVIANVTYTGAPCP